MLAPWKKNVTFQIFKIMNFHGADREKLSNENRKLAIDSWQSKDRNLENLKISFIPPSCANVAGKNLENFSTSTTPERFFYPE